MDYMENRSVRVLAWTVGIAVHAVAIFFVGAIILEYFFGDGASLFSWYETGGSQP